MGVLVAGAAAAASEKRAGPNIAVSSTPSERNVNSADHLGRGSVSECCMGSVQGYGLAPIDGLPLVDGIVALLSPNFALPLILDIAAARIQQWRGFFYTQIVYLLWMDSR
jgi:hypothetical protein